MKYKLTIAIIVTVLLIGGGIAETIFVNDTFDSLESRLTTIMSQSTFSFEDIKATETWWNKRTKLLEITIPHIQLTEITVTFGELVGAMEEEDYDSASALLNRIYHYSVEIGNQYGFKLKNVF
ncbi:MAG: DUF4363 family protein [Christensenellales bacterium]